MAGRRRARRVLRRLVADAYPQLEEALVANPHLQYHMGLIEQETGDIPKFVKRLDDEVINLTAYNMIYPVGDPVFIHIYSDPDGNLVYNTIEPHLTEPRREVYERTLNRVMRNAAIETELDEVELDDNILDRLYESSTKSARRFNLPFFKPKEERIGKRDWEVVKYYVFRDIDGLSQLEPLFRDPYLEEFHATGTDNIVVIHKIFKMMESNLKFETHQELNTFLRTLAERMGQTLSPRNRTVDGTLPDGTHVNIVLGEERLDRSSSFTFRKFSGTPLSLTGLVARGTFSPEEMAYLWLALENGLNIFFCGETASGKTTALNAMLPLIDFNTKVFTIEYQPEMQPPQRAWQSTLIKDTSDDASDESHKLLTDALRARPDLIVLGEIKGREASVAFQAMQTGHQVISTIHAASVRKLVQRLTGAPFNIPRSYMDNLHVAVVLRATYVGGRIVHRCTNITEIMGYTSHDDRVKTRTVFQWDMDRDQHIFKGLHNSYILEEVIARLMGFDQRQVYKELSDKERFITRMVEKRVFNYKQVGSIMQNYRKEKRKQAPRTAR